VLPGSSPGRSDSSTSAPGRERARPPAGRRRWPVLRRSTSRWFPTRCASPRRPPRGTPSSRPGWPGGSRDRRRLRRMRRSPAGRRRGWSRCCAASPASPDPRAPRAGSAGPRRPTRSGPCRSYASKLPKTQLLSMVGAPPGASVPVGIGHRTDIRTWRRSSASSPHPRVGAGVDRKSQGRVAVAEATRLDISGHLGTNSIDATAGTDRSGTRTRRTHPCRPIPRPRPRNRPASSQGR
jgi:hypothetical protein